MKLFFSLVVVIFMGAISLAAQDETITADDLVVARKVMSDIEAQYLRSGEDQNASALILESKLANESAFAYLLQLQGYKEAVDNEQLLPFIEDMKKEHKEYRKLAKEAEKAKKRKWDYISSVDEDYLKAVEMYREVK